MQKKTLTFTVTTDLSYDQRMSRICLSLAQKGYDVTLIGRELPQSKPLQTRIFKQKRLKCFFHFGKFFYLEYNIRLFFYLLFVKTDVMTAIDLDTILPNFYVSLLRRKPLVYDAHEYFSELPEVVTRPTIKKIWETVAQHTVPNVAAAYTVGFSLAQIFEKRYGIPFKTVRNIAQTKTKTSLKAQTDAPKILLYQGVLNLGRGLEEMILAMHHIENAEFWLAGEGDLSAELRNLVENENLNHKVKFLGYLLPNDLQNITEKAYLGINLLENLGLNYYFSLANKFFDYLHAQIPSVNPAFPEYLHLLSEYQTGVAVPDLNPKTIAQSIQNLLNDEKKYKHLQSECRRAAPHLNWENEALTLIQIYDDLFKDTNH